MKRHLKRKFKCPIIKESYNYSENELYELSMKKHTNDILHNNEEETTDDSSEDDKNNDIRESLSNDKNIIIENIIDFKKDIQINDPTKFKINDEMNDAINDAVNEAINYSCHTQKQEDSEKNICSKCSSHFKFKSNLNRHIKNNKCKQHSVTNITNNNTLNQQNNIININFKIIKPFDEEWDVSKIDNKLKNILLLSDTKYTKTLEHILNNDTNLNVIIEDSSNVGIVYKNDTEKFKPMSINDIVDKSMDKLHKHLQDFHEEIKDSNEFKIRSDYLEDEKETIQKRYDDYKNNKNIQNKVMEHIINIYNSKKKDTIKLCKELLIEPEDKFIKGY
jgi:hypothetical protein